jgi:hypothetical protein
MNRQLMIRLIIDFALTSLLLCVYAYRIIGDTTHEWIGVSVFVVCIVHNVLNWKWYYKHF